MCIATSIKGAVNMTKSEHAFTAAVLNLWVMTPLEVAYQLFCISAIYSRIHNSSKLSYKVATKLILCWELITEELYY